MSDHEPSEPGPADFKETAQRSQDASIADESAAYENAAETDAVGGAVKDSGADAEAHPS